MHETTNLTEIKIMLLYVLDKMGACRESVLLDVILMRINVNYFSLVQYLSELVSDNYIESKGEALSLLPKGSEALSYFVTIISASNRKKLDTEMRNRLDPPIPEVYADFTPVAEDDFKINMSITEDNNPLMKLMMSAGSLKTAKNMCASFYKNKEEIYTYLARKLGDFRGFKAVVFDLDGTLIDTLEDLANSTNCALAACGYEIHSIDKYKYFVGSGAMKLIERALPESARTPDEIKRVRAVYSAEYEKRWADKTTIYPEIDEILSALSEKGILTGVLSNKPDEFVKKCVNHFFPHAGFSFACGGKEGMPLKPAPEALFSIMEEYGLSKKDVMFVGDSDIDMILGKNAEVFTVGASWGFRGERELIKNGATFIAKTPKDILKIIS